MFGELGLTKLDLVRTTSPWPRARCAASGAGRWSSSASSRASPRRRSSRSARRRSGRTSSTSSSCKYASGHLRRRRSVIHDAAGLGVGGQPRLRRPQPAPRARRRPRPPRRAAGRPRPMPGVAVGADRRRRARRPRRAGGPRPDGVAEDVGRRAASTSMPGSTAAGRSSRCGWPRRPSPARSSAAPRDMATSRWWKEERQGRLRRLQPERQGPHRGVGVLGARRRRTPGSRPRWLGRGRRLPARGVHDRHRAARGSPRAGDPWAGMDDAAGSLDALLELAERLGPAEKAAEEAPDAGTIDDAADRDRPHQDQGRGAGRRWSAGRTATRTSSATCEPADVLVDGMRGQQFALVPDPDQSAARA